METEATSTERPTSKKIHKNVLKIVGADSVSFGDGSFVISKGQPYDDPPVTCKLDKEKKGVKTWKITAHCGRHKTKPPAETFIRNAGGEDHIPQMSRLGGDRLPKELNFTFKLWVSLDIGRKTVKLPFYFGQGSTQSVPLVINNWWIGSPELVHVATNDHTDWWGVIVKDGYQSAGDHLFSLFVKNNNGFVFDRVIQE